MPKKVTLIYGDGIGPEVIGAAVQVLEGAGVTTGEKDRRWAINAKQSENIEAHWRPELVTNRADWYAGRQTFLTKTSDTRLQTLRREQRKLFPHDED